MPCLSLNLDTNFTDAKFALAESAAPRGRNSEYQCFPKTFVKRKCKQHPIGNACLVEVKRLLAARIVNENGGCERGVNTIKQKYPNDRLYQHAGLLPALYKVQVDIRHSDLYV